MDGEFVNLVNIQTKDTLDMKTIPPVILKRVIELHPFDLEISLLAFEDKASSFR